MEGITGQGRGPSRKVNRVFSCMLSVGDEVVDGAIDTMDLEGLTTETLELRVTGHEGASARRAQWG